MSASSIVDTVVSGSSIVDTVVSDHTNVVGEVIAPTAEVDEALSEALKKVVVKGGRSKKSKSDPDAPKRPMSNYFLWLKENRQAIGDEYCGDLSGKEKVTTIAKKAGEMWKELSDEEKEPFSTEAAELREVYHEKMKLYKPTAVKAKGVVYDSEEIPEAPAGWSGSFDMRHQKGKVKGAAGKTVRIQKVFLEAVKLANDINETWSVACNEGDLPSHWSENGKPCNGITKTSTGYDLRSGVDLITTPEKDKKTGIASWVCGEYAAPKATVTGGTTVYDEETDGDDDDLSEPVEKKGEKTEKKKTEKKAEKSEKKKKEKKVEKTESPAEKTESPAEKSESPAEKSESPAEKSESPAEKSEKKAEKSESPEPKKKVFVKKVSKKSKYPVEDMETIEIEKDGEDMELMMHEDSGDVFEKSNLLEPVGKVEDGEIMFF